VLWRWFHQFHHSPQRIEVITSFYKHPFELVANSILSSAILYLLVGLGPKPAAYAVLLTGLAELFYHWNVPTPHWLGYIVQRPESHCVHHQENVHSYNFADLPLWDILFGTFRNPRRFEARCGFGQDELRVGQMLRGVDVTVPVPAPTSSGDSTRFFLEWTDRSTGTAHSQELTPEIYSRMRGPYNRRNVYGAVLAYGPVLPAELRDPVARYALCGEAPLLRELGIETADIAGPVRVRYEPVAGTRLPPDIPRILEAPCP
jgi:hypothetical protein